MKYLIVLLFACFYFNCAFSQKNSFKILSLEGKQKIVNIVLDNSDANIQLYLNDSSHLCIRGYLGLVEDISIINKQFIAIHFNIPGGSGVGLRRYVLVAVTKDKLYTPFDVMSEFSDETGFYNLNFYKVKTNLDSCKLFFKVISGKNTEDSNKRERIISFIYHNKLKVFYNHIGSLNGSYEVEPYNNLDKKEMKFNLNNYPILQLGKDKYYYLNGKWYLNDSVKHITLLNYDCN